VLEPPAMKIAYGVLWEIWKFESKLVLSIRQNLAIFHVH